MRLTRPSDSERAARSELPPSVSGRVAAALLSPGRALAAAALSALGRGGDDNTVAAGTLARTVAQVLCPESIYLFGAAACPLVTRAQPPAAQPSRAATQPHRRSAPAAPAHRQIPGRPISQALCLDCPNARLDLCAPPLR
jgi:pyruvate/2-oxoglutarate dehydrogenase complex dihydrolipoamide acyltransferase (E2) component